MSGFKVQGSRCVSVCNTVWQWFICDDSQGCVLYVVVNNSKVLWGDLHCVVISAVCAWLLCVVHSHLRMPTCCVQIPGRDPSICV